MAKNNNKSIRLSDEVMAYIENYEGDGFNAKFENIILYAMKTEKQREKRLKELDDMIASKKKSYEEILLKFKQIDSVLYSTLDLDRRVKSLRL